MMRKQKSNYYKLFPVAPIMDGGRRGYSTSASSSVALLTNVTAKLNKVRTVSSMGSDDVYVVGNGGVILKGLNGSNMTQMTISGFNSNLYDIAISNGISLAVGQAGQIVKYNGTNWVPVNNMEALALNATDMIGASGTGYGVGKNGMIAKTEDAGYTWTKIDTKKTQSLYGVAFRDNVNGVAVGDNGAIMRTVNGGLDYFKATVNKPSGLIANLKAVQWVNDKLGFIAGAGGMVLKTIDGGVNWTTETTGSTSDFTSVYFPDKQVGYAVGSNKAIYKAQLNIGTGVYAWTATPELDPAASAFNLNSVYFVDREIGYVSGTGGRLYKTINGGDSWVKDANVSTSAGSNNIGKIIPVDRTNFFVAGAGTTLTHVNDEKDQYSVKLWYDELGRVVLKQDSRQFPTKSYSYSVYDEFNRIIEAGEVSNLTAVSSYANTSVRSQVKYNNFLTWLNGNASQKKQVSFTAYDKAIKVFAGSTQSSFEQENLRPRVSSTYYVENSFSGAARNKVLAGTYDFASHYSYDEHGNVKTLISETKQLEGLNESLKRVDYVYDLVSGNVLEVVYQEGRKDQFMHKYSYDADNRIVNALTSKDGVVWETDAHYEYYRHSVLKRTEIGENKVQGLDYFYTIHGWLKGVNSETLKSNRDLGKDGSTEAADEKEWTAKDVYGFSLKYYQGDYKSIGTIAQNDNALAKEDALYASTNNLYNGNIGAMVTSISKFDNGAPQAMAYGYDQLNRIVSATAYGHTSISSSNDWLGLAQKAAYHETYSYDANGNILSLTRTDGDGAAMDNFTYKYAQVDNQTATVFKKNTNRLMAVEDAVTGNAAKKLGDIQAGQVYDEQTLANNNYEYDGIGNLVKDAQEEIASIKWHVNGKVTSVTRTTGSIKPDLEFQYDAMGNRTVKIVKPRTINGVTDESKWEYSYYVRDASGNVMAIYNKKYAAAGNSGYKESYTLLEQDIYGSSRLGTYTPVDNVIASRDVYGTIDATTKKINISSVQNLSNKTKDATNLALYAGHKSYELSNHLGNVLAVVSDRILPISSNATTVEEFDADVVSASDYTPFGMAMDKRKYSTPSYRYAFNGKEHDLEGLGGGGSTYDYGFRIYNSALGKFLSVDPLTRDYSMLTPYQFASNSPVSGVDLDGLEYFYAADGTLLAKLGTSTEVRLVTNDNLENFNFAREARGEVTNTKFSETDKGKEIIKTKTEEMMTLSSSTGLNYEELNVRAMLYTIRNTESWGTKTLDYDDQFGGGKFAEGKTDEEKYKDHPRKSITKWGKTSSASGAYMILAGSWDWIKGKIGATDFSPENQDKAAVWLMKYRGALDYVKTGKIKEAFVRLKNEWTSLPGAKEEGLSYDNAMKVFKEGISKELNNNSEIKTPQGDLLK